MVAKWYSTIVLGLIPLSCSVIEQGTCVLEQDTLTHLSLASFLGDTGKQNSPRCDAAERGVPSGAILFEQRNFIEKRDEKIRITPNTPKNESGLTQLIMMGVSICQIWIKLSIVLVNVQKH